MKKSRNNFQIRKVLSLTLLFSIFSFALLAQAATGPASIPSETSNKPFATFSGILFNDQTKIISAYSQFVGITKNNFAGGFLDYQKAGELCAIDHPGSHVCQAGEITNSLEIGNTNINSISSGTAWINNGPPAFISTQSNDCNGWKANLAFSAAATFNLKTYGSVWDFKNKKFTMFACENARPFACCQ